MKHESVAKDSFFDRLDVVDKDIVRKGRELIKKYGKE